MSYMLICKILPKVKRVSMAFKDFLWPAKHRTYIYIYDLTIRVYIYDITIRVYIYVYIYLYMYKSQLKSSV